jgi:hypothetical protein
MTRLPLQRTRFDRLQRRIGTAVFGGFQGSWRRRSLAVLALLLGFYGGQNVTALWLERIGQRPVVVLVLVVLLELVVLYLGGSLAILLVGPGRFSFDAGLVSALVTPQNRDAATSAVPVSNA